jgi:hypothetical protein
MARIRTWSDGARVCAVIPIAVFIIIDAGSPSRASLHCTPENVHVPLESAFTMRWKP